MPLGPHSTDADCTDLCPVARAHGVLSGKWTTLIIRDLIAGARRYSALARSLEGISPRMLAMRLDELEAAGLVDRKVFPTVPPHTEYSLTALGREAVPVIEAMAAFGRTMAGEGPHREPTH